MCIFLIYINSPSINSSGLCARLSCPSRTGSVPFLRHPSTSVPSLPGTPSVSATQRPFKGTQPTSAAHSAPMCFSRGDDGDNTAFPESRKSQCESARQLRAQPPEESWPAIRRAGTHNNFLSENIRCTSTSTSLLRQQLELLAALVVSAIV